MDLIGVFIQVNLYAFYYMLITFAIIMINKTEDAVSIDVGAPLCPVQVYERDSYNF